MKIINSQTLGDMCEYMLDGEPVFLIRAQDKVALKVIDSYLIFAFDEKATNLGRVRDMKSRIRKWQEDNPNRVKVPD